MHINAKMIPVETDPGMGGAVRKRSGGWEFKCDIFDTL
jgi:hypothetical protein